jgi:hypothetical protein
VSLRELATVEKSLLQRVLRQRKRRRGAGNGVSCAKYEHWWCGMVKREALCEYVAW